MLKERYIKKSCNINNKKHGHTQYSYIQETETLFGIK